MIEVQQKTFNVLTVSQIETAVREALKVPKYECIPYEEWGNDGINIVHDINGELDLYDEQSLFDKHFIQSEGRIDTPGIYVLMNQLCKMGVIPPGTYLIET